MHIPYAYVEGLRVNCSVSIKLQEKSRTQNCRCIYIPLLLQKFIIWCPGQSENFVIRRERFVETFCREEVGRASLFVRRLFFGRRLFLAEGYFWPKAIFSQKSRLGPLPGPEYTICSLHNNIQDHLYYQFLGTK